jgi:pimeloyl-ACP methyl ester carboxylesterase
VTVPDLAVPIIAGTAIRGVAATLMMRTVLQRHPNAFLITLANFGVTLPLHRSQDHLTRDIRAGLEQMGRDPGDPIVLVGHSQGGLAVLRYAIDHPKQVLHAISVGAPWSGAVSATRLTNVLGRRGSTMVPAIKDMRQGSRFLQSLHRDLPAIADRVTNIYSTHELFIRPYTDAHIDVPGVENILIASQEEHVRHLAVYPELPVDDLIMGRVNHISEMNSPMVRSRIWSKVDEVAIAHGLLAR